MRLKTLLTLIVNALILAFFAAFGLYMAQQVKVREQEELKNELLSTASILDLSIADDLLLEKFDFIESKFRRAVLTGELRELVLADNGGRVLVHVRRSGDGQAVLASDIWNKLIPLKEGFLSEAGLLKLGQPIKRGELIGWIEVGSSLDRMQRQIQTVWTNILVFSLLALFIFSLLIHFFIGRLAGAIVRTSEFAGMLMGQKGVQIERISRVTEIQSLMNSLNQVSQALAEEHAFMLNSESRKNAILLASQDALISMNDRGLIVDFNPAAERIFGYRHEDVEGKRLSDVIIPPALRQAHENGMRRFKQTGNSEVFNRRIEIHGLHSSGSVFPVELSISPFKINEETYYLGSLRDITERKNLESEQENLNITLQNTLSELQSRQSALDEHAVVCISDRHDRIIYANQKLERISGYSSTELIGLSVNSLRASTHLTHIEESLNATIRSGEVWHGEIAHHTKDGHLYWLDTTVVPLFSNDGTIDRFISIGADITAHKDALEKIDQYRLHLESLIGQYRSTQASLEEARQREVHVGHLIQKSLLFGQPPAFRESLAISAYTEPSKGIDGDFYEFFSFSKDVIDISLGDVMGKGVTAALIGAGVKQELGHFLAQLTNTLDLGHFPEPVDLVNALHQKVTPKLQELESFITLIYLRLDLARQQAIYVNAGHTHSILVREKGIYWLEGEGNLPLGVMVNEQYRQSTQAFSPGDVMFLYSDGFTEARNSMGDEFGSERMANWLQLLYQFKIPPAIMVQSLRHVVRQFEAVQITADDRTCVAMRLGLLQHHGARHEVEIPWEITALDPVRLLTQQYARSAGLTEEKVAALTLAVFETVTNVIRHADPPLDDATLHLSIEERPEDLRVTFHYLGGDFLPEVMNPEAMPDFSGESQGGFGLYIIRNSVDAVHYSNPVEGICRIELEVLLVNNAGPTRAKEHLNA